MSNTKGTSAIESPQGGGAQSGLGEKFSPNLFTGTGNFSVPIAVPFGRNGFQPELTLGYSTGHGNGVFGMGWALGIPGVTRKTSRGIPVYSDGQDVFILSGAEDLVPVKKETTSGHQKMFYRPRTEGLFARIIHHKKTNGENYWEVRSKDGLISFYGTPDSEGNDPCVIANPENRNAIFSWCLSKTVDPYGNEIVYEYERELVTASTAANPHKYDQLYLSSIKYAQYYENGDKKYLCEIKLNYEERPDPFSSYRQGFEIRTTRRCVSIETFTHADETSLIKTYHLNYLSGDKLPLNGVSMLKNIAMEGHKGDDNEWMPPVEFGYSKFNPTRRGLRSIKGPIPMKMLSQPGFELADLNGNGLPDLLQLDGVARYWTNKGDGTFSPPRMLELAPTVQLGQAGVHLIDANGNGRYDLLVANEAMNGYFPGEFGGVWSQQQFRPYSKAPSVNIDDPEVQLMDLNGNGITDVLRNGAKFECFFNDPQKGFDKVRVTEKTFANFSFADPRIRFADMTGDGLQDIVLISSGRVQYWPNLGYGRFGQKVNMKNAPRFPEQYNPAQVLLGDLDGDGLADIAFVENNSVTLYVNQSANGFSEGTRVVNTPAVFDPNDLRITDILGTGQPGILWSMPSNNGRTGRMFFLDFTDNNKPYVLEEMNNNMGSLTRVEYGSSIYHYLRDQKNPLTKWQTELPFPVQVVNKVEAVDLLSGGKSVTEYRYHHGYWDGAEREFRGFARVDTLDTETFEKFNSQGLFTDENINIVTSEQYSPQKETRNWFYPGPVGSDFTRWHEIDFSQEYWQGDANVLERTNQMKALLASLSRRARRDALRALRGTLLRSETYGLDGMPLQDNPYTVTENLMSVRKEFDPAQDPDLFNGWGRSGQGFWAGTGFVFFPFNLAQRITQYERGNDPMHSMSFVQEYDAFGNPIGELSIGLPRGSSPWNGGSGKYLATYKKDEFVYKDIDNGQYMVNRVKRTISYDATKPSGATSVFSFKDSIFDSQATLPIIGCTLNFFDGDAFQGLPFGEIGNFGAVVRSETLVITDDIITEAYGANTPECFRATPDWSTSNGYPSTFAGELQNGDVRLGYKDRRAGFPNHVPGWYAESERIKYDWQVGIVPNPCGLVLESKDVFENRTSLEFDAYQIFAINSKQWLSGVDYLETSAEYDYRVMRAVKIIDPNDNITEFDFSPLGLLTATAVIGKGTEGDYKAATGSFYERFAPSVRMEYDFSAFINDGNPIWVKTIQREQHWQDDPDSNSPTIVTIEYSDGFGRLLQTRSQAEDVIYGNETFGSSGLSSNQNAQNAPALGVERDSQDPLNVVVSGWKIYNNKGEVVEQYEPFFDKGFEYTLPQLSNTGGTIPPQLGVKIKKYYDPLGRVVKTVNPDNSEQRTIYGIPNALNTPNNFSPTPWEYYSYDANDLAPLTNPENSNVPASHWYTPKSSLIDSLGRIIQTKEHNAHYNENTSQYEDVVMLYFYDIRGNLLEIRDPFNRKVFEYIHDLKTALNGFNSSPLKTNHIDRGVSITLNDATGKVIEFLDAKGAMVLSAFDKMNRQTKIWAKDNSTEAITLRQVLIYGDDLNDGPSNPETSNYLGQLYKHYDEAGLVTIEGYDFKGNVLEKLRETISDADLLAVFSGPPSNWDVNCFRVDWSTPPSLEGNYLTSIEYDALNRVSKMFYPEDVDSERKILIPSYNRAGALKSLIMDNNDYINHIAYNTKGQRLLIAYGNSIMTRYLYDNKRFQLVRMRSEKYVQDGWSFTPDGGVKQDTKKTVDLCGNIVATTEANVSGCGIGGSNTLSREFSYDPLYRILSANGRENSPSITPFWDDRYRSADHSLTTAYTQNYSYDRLGNMIELRHIGNNDFTRDFSYVNTNNQLQNLSVGMTNYAFTYDDCGNQLTESSSRHFEWDFDNRLRSFYVQAGTSEPTQYAQYLYDASGNRVKKMVRTQGGNYTSTVYIDNIFETKTDGVDTQNLLHVMDDNSRVALIRLGDDFGDTTPALKYNLENHLGSSTLLLEASGAIISREEYYPFGETSFGSYAKKRYKFSGKERDEESGLYYCKDRYYSAWCCRFVSVDFKANEFPNHSPYCFAGNNPNSQRKSRMDEPEGCSIDHFFTSTNRLSFGVGGGVGSLEQAAGYGSNLSSGNDGSLHKSVANRLYKKNIQGSSSEMTNESMTTKNLLADIEQNQKRFVIRSAVSKMPYIPFDSSLNMAISADRGKAKKSEKKSTLSSDDSSKKKKKDKEEKTKQEPAKNNDVIKWPVGGGSGMGQLYFDQMRFEQMMQNYEQYQLEKKNEEERQEPAIENSENTPMGGGGSGMGQLYFEQLRFEEMMNNFELEVKVKTDESK